MQDVLEGYAAVATADFIAAYDGLSPEIIYEHVIDLFPDRSITIADIGAGTGRDAAWFAAKGHDVLAIEPVRELREAGQALHPAANISGWMIACHISAQYRPARSISLLCAPCGNTLPTKNGQSPYLAFRR